MELNHEFLIETFYSFCKRPLYKKFQNVFNSECPICKEGKSAGRTRRLFYFPNKEYFYCHNCVQSWKPLSWIQEVTGWGFGEIIAKNAKHNGENSMIKHGEFLTKDHIIEQNQAPYVLDQPELPVNPIDLTSPEETNYFKDNFYIKTALNYCRRRMLFTAVNRCKKFYVSLEDKVHKHRLIIPFYDSNDNIVCYQTRSLTEKQFPRYLTKTGEKEIFGLNNVCSDIPYVFIFEGPIDSMFVRNGVALASLSPTAKQLQTIQNLFGYEPIWIFDNDKNNKQTQRKIIEHINNKKRVFVWPKELLRFKDFNEVCCNLKINEIKWQFVIKNSFVGKEALIKYKLSLATNPT